MNTDTIWKVKNETKNKTLKDIMENNQLSDNLKKELQSIYYLYEKLEDNNEKNDLKEKVNDVLEAMFKTAFSYAIPMEFIDSSVGKMLFKIKLEVQGSNELVYGVTEIMIIAKKSKQSVVNAFSNGDIDGIKTGQKQRMLCTEEALQKYLSTSGRSPYTDQEAKERIKLFNKLYQEGCSNEDIKKELAKRME